MKLMSEITHDLKIEVQKRFSAKRFAHTEGVVKAAVWLSVCCLPNKREELIYAAYLHDITKELSIEEHLSMLAEWGVLLTREEQSTEAVLHSFTAPLVVKEQFSKYATDDVLSAVYNHTLGSPDMSVFDEIIFLADFIEENRKYDASASVRDFVRSNMELCMYEENIKILHKACIKSIDFTLRHLIDNEKLINPKNILTRNALLGKI